MTEKRSDQLMAEYIEMMLEPGTVIDVEAILASPESQQIRREGEERARSDWPNLNRFRAANEEVRRGPAPVLVMLGDSITENWGYADPGLAGLGIVNRGIGGQVSAQLLVRIAPDVVGLRPRAVHLMVGTNDVAGGLGPVSDEDFQGTVTSMLDIAEAHGIRVILGSIPPVSRFPWNPALDPVPVVARWNAWLRATAAERGAVYADYFSALADATAGLDPRLGNDAVHPHRGGYELMRPILDEAMRSLGLTS